MFKRKGLTTATFVTLAMLSCVSSRSHAAQCGSSAAGYAAWTQEFAREAQAKGISASTSQARFSAEP